MQILGAEKALFRALKTKGNTPKYGLIYHSTFIGRADAKNKGRISRYLANKCSIATRIDSFADEPSSAYGQKLRDQVEERLKFYETGAAPRKNIDVMEEVARHLKAGKDAEDDEMADAEKKKKKKDKKAKRKSEAADNVEEDVKVRNNHCIICEFDSTLVKFIVNIYHSAQNRNQPKKQRKRKFQKLLPSHQRRIKRRRRRRERVRISTRWSEYLMTSFKSYRRLR